MRDVIVVGAGGGGPVLAKELASRGLDVLMLEAGAANADPEREWTHFETGQNNPVFGAFRWGPADLSKPPWFRDLAGNMVVQQAAGVGGTTLHYFGNSPRAYPGAFQGYAGADRDAYDTDHLFPLSYRDLIPYYEWVEYTLPVLIAPMGTKEEVFFRGAGAVGLPVNKTVDVSSAGYRPQQNCVLQPSGTAGKTADSSKLLYPHAQGCTFCGHCLQGCFEPVGAPRNLKAKRSTDNSYVPMALTADCWSKGGKRITLISDAFAVRIGTEGNAARSVTWRVGATGELFTEEAKVIVMAAGVVESPRLWLNSGLPNPNDWVGRGLTDHAADGVAGICPFYTGTSKGAGSNARADFPGHGALEQFSGNPSFTASAATLSDSGMAGSPLNGSSAPGYGADHVGPLFGKELKNTMANIDQLMILVILTDDDVEAQNRVSLSTAAPPDENGQVPRIEISQLTRTARTKKNREFLAEHGVRILRAAGATKVYRFNFPPTLLHIHSTMRMGSQEADSVLDENCEARWLKRLYVADNSGLANSVGGANPTLTTQALATRTAEKIFQKYFGGTAWVRKESPVCSTDDSVTRAVLSGSARVDGQRYSR
jgi:choline dehydrogenase-like flavoprotein